MRDEVKDSVILKASKGRWLAQFSTALVFLAILLGAQFPDTWFFLVFRLLMAPICVLGIVVCGTAVVTNKYNLVLDSEGVEFGSFYGRQRYKWSRIKATGVIRPLTGKRVFIELAQPTQSQKRGSLPLKYLPDNYGMDADELAKTLLRWQREYGGVLNS